MTDETCNLFDDAHLSDLLGFEGTRAVSKTGCALFDDIHALTNPAAAAPKLMPATDPAPATEAAAPTVSLALRQLSTAPTPVRRTPMPEWVYRAPRERQGHVPKRKETKRFRSQVLWYDHWREWPGWGRHADAIHPACGQPIKLGSWTAKGAIIWLGTSAFFPESGLMSCLSPFDFKEDRSESAEIDSLVLMRGGHFVVWGTHVALVVLDGKPVIILMDGPAVGTQARLSKAGLSRLGKIWKPVFFYPADGQIADRSDVPDQSRVHDLAAGAARLRDVMQTILEDIRPQISAQIACDAVRQKALDTAG